MKERINVLHVLNSAQGGSALSTFQLIEELKKHDVQSSLVCFNNASEEQKSKILELVDNRVIFIPLYWSNKRTRVTRWKRPLLEALTAWQTWWGYKYQSQISKLIHNNQINIVHTSTIVNPEGAIAARRNITPKSVKERINVLHVLNSAQGGSALSTFQLIEELKKHDVQSSLVCFNNASEEQTEVISQLVEGRVLFIPLYWTNKRIRGEVVETALVGSIYLAKYLDGLPLSENDHGLDPKA